MTRRTFDELHLRKLLLRAVARAGGPEAFARQHELNEHYVIDATRGLTAFSAKLLKAMGFERVPRFAKRRDAA